MRSGDFHGHETVIIENEHFQLECLANAGPRIVRLIPSWMGENLFAEMPGAAIRTALGEYHYFGGHRLWTAPKSLVSSFSPDDYGVSVKDAPNGLRLVGGLDDETFIWKTITVQLSPNQPFIMLKHKIENRGSEPVRVAPCAITMLRPNGTVILPQQVGTLDKEGFLPNRNFSLWSYSRWDDPRLMLGSDFIKIKADDTKRAFKLGYFNAQGWLGYVFEDVFFVKRFGVRRDEEFPDNGCNSEVYITDRVVELESLGAITELQPNESVIYTETWEVYRTNAIPKELLGGKMLDEVLK